MDYAKVNPASSSIPKVYKHYVLAGMILTILIVVGLVGTLVWALVYKHHKHPCSCEKCKKKCCPQS